jgi:citrate synthase
MTIQGDHAGGATIKAGLEGVVAGASKICRVDGEKGELFYWGYNIHDLAQQASFEETAYLLWNGELPNKVQLQELSSKLIKQCELNSSIRELIKGFPRDASPMAVLRTAVSALEMYDPFSKEKDLKTNRERAILLLGHTAAIVAGFERVRHGSDFVPPREDLNFASNFLYMMTGSKPDETSSRAFNIALVLHADHELNASTFAGRVTAATLAGIYAAVTSAIGALEGPLHGGANEAVMKMLLEIGDVSRCESYVKKALSEKKKIPGFGHRVYRTEDPRATHLRKMAKELGEKLGQPQWYEMLRKIESIMWEEKKLYPNVDCYSAAVYRLLNIPIDLYTPIFAVSRMSGWTAHILEQYSDNRLIRPRAEYIGPSNRVFVPLNER